MHIHHLNCGTLRPPGESMVCHVLLLETDSRLALVDAGFGTADVRDPRRLGPVRHVIGTVLREEETAIAQIRALGLEPADVTDIVLTHGDLDHAGGISDFPGARVHLLADEHVAIHRRRGLLESQRYRPAQWAHRPHLIGHPPGDGTWKGFEQVVALDEVLPGMLLVPLPGHTAGHAGVALPIADGWLLHAGDAFHSSASLERGHNRPDVHLRQGLLAQDGPALRRTQRALSALAGREDLQVINSHDRGLWEASRDGVVPAHGDGGGSRSGAAG